VISRDDWLNAVAELQPVTDDSALTATELGVLFNKRRTATRLLISDLLRAGRATITSKVIIDNGGRRQIVPAYRLTSPPKTKKPK
jgi:hypothetical protein